MKRLSGGEGQEGQPIPRSGEMTRSRFEVFQVADRVSVIRDGKHISTRLVCDTNPQKMIAEMVGREVGNYFTKMASTARDEVLLKVEGLGVAGIFDGVSFDLRRGEVLAMAGLIGARRTDVALALFGILRATSGTVTYKGKPMAVRSPGEAIAAGIAYVSEDRRKLGLAMALPMRWNVSLATLKRYLSRIQGPVCCSSSPG